MLELVNYLVYVVYWEGVEQIKAGMGEREGV